MTTTHKKHRWVIIGVLLAVAGTVRAGTAYDLGTAAPPTVLGGYTMTPFGTDASALDSLLSSLSTPIGGWLTFSTDVRHDQIGNGYATWSHGYSGDVYDSTADVNSLTLGLPTETGAFYFYAEPNQWDRFQITATCSDGTQVSVPVQGNGGANGFGFAANPGDYITSIVVTTTDLDFALGEFGIAEGGPATAPEGGSSLAYAVLSFLGLGGARFCFRGKNKNAR